MDFTLADLTMQWTHDPWRAMDHLGAPRPPKPFRAKVEANMPWLREKLKQARRMKLSEKFTRTLYTEAVGQSLERCLARCDLANLPFDTMWVEYDAPIRLDYIANYAPSMEDDPDKPALLGWLFYRVNSDDPTRWRAIEYAHDVEGFTTAAYFAYDFGAPITAEHEYALHTAAAWGFGTSEYPMFVPDLAARCSVVPEPILFREMIKQAPQKTIPRLMVRSFEQMLGRRGDLVLLVTLLAMINYVPVRYHHRASAGVYRKRLKNLSYLDYREVSIEAGSTRIETVVDSALKDAEKTHRRAHEVRGHWRHWLSVDRCLPYETHVWEGEDLKQECARCKARRSWIDKHVRGDAALGWVNHDYQVTK